MADFKDRFALVTDGPFTNRLQMAVWIAACDIIIEAPGTVNHAARLAWANKQLKGEMDNDKMRIVAIRVSANASIGSQGANAPDADIQFVVNGLINELAT